MLRAQLLFRPRKVSMRAFVIAPAAIALLSLPLWFAESRAAAGTVMQHMVDSYFVMFLNALGSQFGCFI